MKDKINYEIPDLYLEHSKHNTFCKQCSTCFSERLQKAEQCGLIYTGELDTNGLPEFIGTQDQWQAFDVLLELRPPFTRGDEEELSLCCDSEIKNGRCFNCKDNCN